MKHERTQIVKMIMLAISIVSQLAFYGDGSPRFPLQICMNIPGLVLYSDIHYRA